ncbi:MAG TPA: deoxyribodipyrimidine photo-lyase [Acidimicrobiales bacterium]|nr:deoxyribodipyrimidine photo-lyase [Acidimicrobiales bacterium]
MTPLSLYWFRRDLRLEDSPALAAAAAAGDVVGVFVADDALLAPAGASRRAYLAATLAALDGQMGGALCVRVGDPAEVLLGLALEVGASAVFASADYGPYGRVRDQRVAAALAARGVATHFLDSPYAVAPGVVRNANGDPYRVFTPFRRAWAREPVFPPRRAGAVGWRVTSGETAATVARLGGTRRPWYFGDLDDGPAVLGDVGESAARERLANFAKRSERYGATRNRPDREGTSRLSAFLHFGVLHPRQVLAAVGEETFVAEIAWREFYGDVLFHRPDSAREPLQAAHARLVVDRNEAAARRFEQWARGESGFPLVDAGMRQLLTEGWMHNRVRMVVASFLVKHLHLDWRWGARWFMWRLFDGDLASNQHGWQWCAGVGTDAAPFHRIFNPTLQAERFDPQGDYIRRYVTELADVDAPFIHRPGAGGWADRYPAPMIDLAAERREALARWAAATRP